MIIFIVILLILLIIESIYSPRLGFAKDKLLLWYGKKTRKFIVII